MARAPSISLFKEHVERKLPAFHRLLNPMPAPLQMYHQRQSRTREAAMLPQPPRQHGDQHDANALRRAERQRVNETTHCCCH